MRLIDADKLKEDINSRFLTAGEKRLLCRIVDKAPTFEERPQGKWIFKHNSSDIWCSVCDENFDEIPQKFNYCPNCGADMREGNNG